MSSYEGGVFKFLKMKFLMIIKILCWKKVEIENFERKFIKGRICVREGICKCDGVKCVVEVWGFLGCKWILKFDVEISLF